MDDLTTCEACGLVTMQLRLAEALAREVEVLVHRGVIDSRSPAADVLLDYRDSKPCTEAGRRIADLERRLEAMERDRAMACIEPDPGCECAGCLYAREVNESDRAHVGDDGASSAGGG